MFWDSMMPVRWWLWVTAEQQRRTPREAVAWQDRDARRPRRSVSWRLPRLRARQRRA